MRTFREIVQEQEMSQKDFMQSVEDNFLKHFPNGYISLDDKSTFGGNMVSCTIGMIGNLKDNTNGIAQNDSARHTFIMWEKDDSGVYSFEGSGRIYINPPEGKNLAMGSVKTKMGNNTKITLQKADTKLKKFFKKLSDLMKEHKDDIYGVEDIDKKYLVFK